jgi:hypothetical protein
MLAFQTLEQLLEVVVQKDRGRGPFLLFGMKPARGHKSKYFLRYFD